MHQFEGFMRLPLNKGMTRFWAEGLHDLESVPRSRGVFFIWHMDRVPDKGFSP